jgi:hypothetical protein
LTHVNLARYRGCDQGGAVLLQTFDCFFNLGDHEVDFSCFAVEEVNGFQRSLGVHVAAKLVSDCHDFGSKPGLAFEDSAGVVRFLAITESCGVVYYRSGHSKAAGGDDRIISANGTALSFQRSHPGMVLKKICRRPWRLRHPT